MRDSLDNFAALAARARGDAAPAVDVASRVLVSLRTRRPCEPVDRTMLVCSALALAASLVFMTWGLDVWTTLTDPLNALLQAAPAVMQ